MNMQCRLGLLLAGLVPFAALAQKPDETPAAPATNSAPAPGVAAKILTAVPITLRSVFRGQHTWEEWHDHWSEDIAYRVDYVDHFFGDRILKDDNRDTRVMLRMGLRVDRFDFVSLESQINVRLSLPQLQRRLQLIVDSGEGPEEVRPLRTYEDAAKSSASDTGVRYLVKADSRMRLHLDIGIHFNKEPQLFGRMRTRYTLPLDLWQLRLQERVEWRSREGFGQTSEMIWDRQLPERAILRLRTALDWNEEDRGVRPSQSLMYYRIINARTSYKAGIQASWPETPRGGNDAYELVTGYRRQIYGDWLFLEIDPCVEFSADRDYAINPCIVAILEINFQRDRPLSGESRPGFRRR